jgi:hypothetical protein
MLSRHARIVKVSMICKRTVFWYNMFVMTVSGESIKAGDDPKAVRARLYGLLVAFNSETPKIEDLTRVMEEYQVPQTMVDVMNALEGLPYVTLAQGAYEFRCSTGEVAGGDNGFVIATEESNRTPLFNFRYDLNLPTTADYQLDESRLDKMRASLSFDPYGILSSSDSGYVRYEHSARQQNPDLFRQLLKMSLNELDSEMLRRRIA